MTKKIFDLDAYTPKTAILKTVDNNQSLVFQINPQTLKESVRTSVQSTQLINSNLPRAVVTGTEGRIVSFKALFHGMIPRKIDDSHSTVQSRLNNSPTSKRFIDIAKRVAQNVPATSVSLIPFGSNVIRGVKVISDIAGFDVSDVFGRNSFEINRDYPKQDIEATIDTLFSMQVAPTGGTNVKRVQISGYPAFEDMSFYITEVSINRRLWDKELRSQFVEIDITLQQVGVKNRVGKFFKDSK